MDVFKYVKYLMKIYLISKFNYFPNIIVNAIYGFLF